MEIARCIHDSLTLPVAAGRGDPSRGEKRQRLDDVGAVPTYRRFVRDGSAGGAVHLDLSARPPVASCPLDDWLDRHPHPFRGGLPAQLFSDFTHLAVVAGAFHPRLCRDQFFFRSRARAPPPEGAQFLFFWARCLRSSTGREWCLRSTVPGSIESLWSWPWVRPRR